MSKYFKEIQIPYLPNRRINLALYKHTTDKGNKWRLTIWWWRRMVGIPGHEDEWGSNKHEHFDVWPLWKR